jgi:hypothetical protein
MWLGAGIDRREQLLRLLSGLRAVGREEVEAFPLLRTRRSRGSALDASEAAQSSHAVIVEPSCTHLAAVD